MFDCCCCSLRALWVVAINFDKDVVGCPVFGSTYFLNHIVAFIFNCNGMWQHIQISVNSQLDKMETLYQKLNKKNWMPTRIQIRYSQRRNKKHTFHSRLINLTHVNFTKEKINTLNVEFNYVIERDPKYYINEIATDTENAIRHLNASILNNFRYLATRKIKRIIEKKHTQTVAQKTSI